MSDVMLSPQKLGARAEVVRQRREGRTEGREEGERSLPRDADLERAEETEEAGLQGMPVGGAVGSDGDQHPPARAWVEGGA